MSKGRLFHTPLDKLEEIGCRSIGEGIEWMAAAVEYVRDLPEITVAQRCCLDEASAHLGAAKGFIERAERLRDKEQNHGG